MKVNKKETEKKGKKLAKRLNKGLGGKWTVRVWENGGWCYDVHLGSISVHETHYGEKYSYFALVSGEINKANYGLGAWTHNNDSADTPEKAVNIAMESAQKYVKNLKEVLDDNISKIKS